MDYEIDLKDKHASRCHKQIGFFIEHPTRVGGRKRRSDRPVVAKVRGADEHRTGRAPKPAAWLRRRVLDGVRWPATKRGYGTNSHPERAAASPGPAPDAADGRFYMGGVVFEQHPYCGAYW